MSFEHIVLVVLIRTARSMMLKILFYLQSYFRFRDIDAFLKIKIITKIHNSQDLLQSAERERLKTPVY